MTPEQLERAQLSLKNLRYAEALQLLAELVAAAKAKEPKSDLPHSNKQN